jgi:hypothetical protein
MNCNCDLNVMIFGIEKFTEDISGYSPDHHGNQASNFRRCKVF